MGVGVQYLEKLYKLYNELVADLHDKTDYTIYLGNLNQALIHSLIFRKIHRVIEFNQTALLKRYIDMKTDLRRKAKNDF